MSESTEQRVWRLEENSKHSVEMLKQLNIAINGDGQPGLRDTVKDIGRDVASLTRLAATVNDLERSAARTAEIKALEARVLKLEDESKKDEGAQLGRRWVWAIVSGAAIIIGGMLTVIVQISTLRARYVGGGG